jgi:hypothetical protein
MGSPAGLSKLGLWTRLTGAQAWLRENDGIDIRLLALNRLIFDLVWMPHQDGPADGNRIQS